MNGFAYLPGDEPERAEPLARYLPPITDGVAAAFLSAHTKPGTWVLDPFGASPRAAVEMAKDWRTDRALRRLEALLTIADAKTSLIISGTGDVIEPEFDLMAIGSGGAFAQAAARALLENTNLSAREIVEQSLKIAADICIYTNHNLRIEELDAEPNE